MSEPMLSVRNLRVEFISRRGKLVAIDDVSFDVAQGEILGVVGESGAGKSVTGAAIVGLIEHPGRITCGEIRLKGDRIDHLPAAGMRKIRGRRIGMVFQDPLSSLNPLFRIGDQIVETMRAHLEVSRAEARRRAVELLDEVGIPAAASRVDSYPHQLSGGMRQRVVLALVLCTTPELIIADEPTTALDVSVQAQIIELIRALTKNYGTSVMLITHDLGVIAEIADRVAVMYAGRLVELGSVRDVLKGAKHPYSQGLMSAIPTLRQGAGPLRQIPGAMPRLHTMPNGCAFHPRCPLVIERCRLERPMLVRSGDIDVACWLHGKDPGQVDGR